jgi:hypothetical protein
MFTSVLAAVWLSEIGLINISLIVKLFLIADERIFRPDALEADEAEVDKLCIIIRYLETC